jgi:uncharacterized membrane protein
MNWTIYLLSLAENVEPIRVLVCIALALTGIVGSCMWRYAHIEPIEEKDAKHKGTAKVLLKAAVVMAVIFILCTLVPTQRGIMRAYLMVEGAKVLKC